MEINLWISMLLMIFCGTQADPGGEWIISDKSRLYIHGNTNINSFRCVLKNYQSSDTLEYVHQDSVIKLAARNRMTVPLKLFDCGSRRITRDMRRALKARLHPDLEIRFHSFTGPAIMDNSYTGPAIMDDSYVDGTVDIYLAGSKYRYKIRYHAERDGTNIKLTGTQSVSFSDFDLRPPQKLNGIIRVKDCLDVSFALQLKER